MDGQWQDTTFVDFGTDALYPFRRGELPRVSGDTQELRAQVRRQVPRSLAFTA